jgi:hypothetical protein
MFSESLISLHLLVLFFCFLLVNNKKSILEKSFVSRMLYFQSLFSPVALFLNYFLNTCLAHNLYCTFFCFKSTFDQRINLYKIYSIIGSLIIFSISFVCNTKTLHSTLIYSLSFYNNSFYRIIYLIGLIPFGYIFYIIYTILKNDEFELLIKISSNTKKTLMRKDLMNLLVRKHILMLLIFIITFLPNNLIMIVQSFKHNKICDDCSNYIFIYYFMSLSCVFTFLMKMSEPYMMKYFNNFKNFILIRKKQMVIR